MHQVRAISAVLFSFSLLFHSILVSADNTPYPALLYCALHLGIPSPQIPAPPPDCSEKACRTLEPLGVILEERTYHLAGHYSGGYCEYSNPLLPSAPNTWVLWARGLICEKGGYPKPDGDVLVPMCECPAGQMFPPGGPTRGGPKCVPEDCPVDDLQPFPPAGDKCSASLEAGSGKDVNNVCPAASVMSDPKGEPCLAQKLGARGIAYTGPTSIVRTAAYQKHLGEVFDKFWQHQWLITDPVAYQACTDKRAIVEAEMSKHGINYPPARIDSAHLDGTAFDISRATVNRIADVPALLRAAPACNLKWGGGFPVPDEVHFFTPPPVPAP
jgi:hypothetical protein